MSVTSTTTPAPAEDTFAASLKAEAERNPAFLELLLNIEHLLPDEG